MRIRALPGWLVPAIMGSFFLLAGLAFIPYPGLQNDELFFSPPLYFPDAAFFHIQAGGTKIPLMVMSYSGALKTWLYAALFEFVAPNPWSVRIPVLLMGVAVVWLTWIWVRRIAGMRAAAIATVLLATDSIFLLTNTFDWGPVALQHLLLMGGLVALERWIARGSRVFLALGFFLWGLGMWDKALFIWPLIGLAVASLVVYPKEVLRRLRPVPALIAVAAFLLGALPLVWYNIERPGETATANAKFTTSELTGKLVALRQTIDGSTLFGYMVYPDSTMAKRVPSRRRERIPVAISRSPISRILGSHQRNWMLPAWLLAWVCFGALWTTPLRRPLLFLLIAMLVAWFQMALTRGAGGASHHVILIWPFPAAFIGIAFAGASRRFGRWGLPVVCLLLALFAAGNVLNTNEYLAEFIVNGAEGGWTDALYPLAGSIESNSADWIGVVDWGYLNGIRLLHEGDLPLFVVNTEAGPAEMKNIVDGENRLFIQHTSDQQIFPGVNERLRLAAQRLGFEEHIERVINDGNGRPVFELFRFQKAGPAS